MIIWFVGGCYNLFVPVITLLKPQKNGRRVNVYLDEKFAFGIDLINLVKNELKVGLELSDEKIKEIVKKSEFQKTLDKLLKFATLRPRSEREIKNYLIRKKVHESLCGDLFEKLKKFYLIDDLAFSRWWIEQRTAFGPRGKRALMVELLGKGVKKEVIEEALKGLMINEKEMALSLVQRCSRKWERYDAKEGLKKKSEFLARKGFSWDIIKEVLSIDDIQ